MGSGAYPPYQHYRQLTGQCKPPLQPSDFAEFSLNEAFEWFRSVAEELKWDKNPVMSQQLYIEMKKNFKERFYRDSPGMENLRPNTKLTNIFPAIEFNACCAVNGSKRFLRI